MKKENSLISIQMQLIEKGFVHIKYNEFIKLDEIISTLGTVINKTEVRENYNGKSRLSSNESMGFHTDHKKANYIVWFCHSQAAIGGETILIDTRPVIDSFSEDELKSLSCVFVQSHKIFPDDYSINTLLTKTKEGNVVYYAPWLAIKSCLPNLLKALQKFENGIKNVMQECILLSEGDILIIDNNRMLHDRKSFPKNSNRWLTRYWIKNNN